MSRRWPPPVYELNHEEGLPHERMFTIHCVIEGKYTETGAGKSKKLAKRQAANKMIQRLRALPLENEDAFQNIDDDELAQGRGTERLKYENFLYYFSYIGLAQRFSQSKESSKSASGSYSQQVSRFHKSLKSSQGDFLSKLKNLSLDEEDECVIRLEEIAMEQHFEVNYYTPIQCCL